MLYYSKVLARRPNGIWAARFAIEYKVNTIQYHAVPPFLFMSVVLLNCLRVFITLHWRLVVE